MSQFFIKELFNCTTFRLSGQNIVQLNIILLLFAEYALVYNNIHDNDLCLAHC